jgi:hypothetical protein
MNYSYYTIRAVSLRPREMLPFGRIITRYELGHAPEALRFKPNKLNPTDRDNFVGRRGTVGVVTCHRIRINPGA